MALIKTFLAAALVLLGGCSAGPSLREEDKEGGYERIISLGPTITQNIYLLGEQDRLVGVSSYCEYLPGVSGREVAGDLVNISLEQVLRLSPDAVMVTEMAGREAAARIEEFGIDVLLFPEPENFDRICSQFVELGRILGTAEKAEKIAGAAREEVEKLRAGTSGLPRKKVIAQIGADPLWVTPRSSFINDIIEFAGGENAGPAEGGRVSVEEVVRRDPDVILIIDMGIAEEQRKMWENYPAVKAVRKGDIHIVDSFVFCSPTPRMFPEAVRKAAEILHGK